MTEAEWLVCQDLSEMRKYLDYHRLDPRKFRLFACACARRIWGLLTDRRSRRSVEATEAFVDGLVTANELDEIHCEASEVEYEARTLPLRSAAIAAGCVSMYAMYDMPECAADDAFTEASEYAAEAVAGGQEYRRQGGAVIPWGDDQKAAFATEQSAQADLLRCLFGNPFHPITSDPTWQTPNAVTLAQTIYEERRWELLPLLADLLEEAGCPAEVSDHGRGGGPHARGCWVVDLVLGQS